ncbi:MAG: hypothetical protein WA006_01210, partial [Rhodoglobus sp.]
SHPDLAQQLQFHVHPFLLGRRLRRSCTTRATNSRGRMIAILLCHRLKEVRSVSLLTTMVVAGYSYPARTRVSMSA